MLADAAAVERRSQHPLAVAVVEEARALDLEHVTAAESVEVIAGHGVRGQLGGLALTVGRHDFIHQDEPSLCRIEFCDAVESAAAAGRTVMVVRDDRRGVRGYIAVSDALRPGTAEVLEALAGEGIQRTVMLTGDNEAMAQVVGQAAGVDEVQAGLLPEDKMAAVESLLDRYKAVAMVGDGVNDAPALARATVGIAMGAAGTDTALETADVALMADDLSRLPFAVRLSRSARRRILQNIVLSLAIKAIFLALALGGAATLWMAVFADMGSSLIVTLNGMRLLREK
jgi:Cd2+/Zn2+-exporting ATPase